MSSLQITVRCRFVFETHTLCILFAVILRVKFSNFTTSSGICFNILSISKEIIMKLSEREKIYNSQNEPWSTGESFLLCH